MITADVAVFLRGMLAGSTLNVGAPDFMEVSALASKALVQLDQIIAAPKESS